MRLFIAVPVPPDIRRAAAAAAEQLRAFGAEGRFVPPENYHVTLRFIGETDDLGGLAEAMSAAVRDIRPFLLRLEDYDSFAAKGGSTGFLRVRCRDEELSRLTEALESALWEQGFSGNRGHFVPHITLGRSIRGDEGFSCPRNAAFTVTEILLYQSLFQRDGSVTYLPVHRERLRS